MPPVSITFSRGKARLLYTNSYCYARTSGAAAHGRRFSTSADTPLTVRFTAITSKFTSYFFYKAFPHLIYSLLRVDKMFGLQSERNGVSENANRNRQLAGGASENANRDRQLAGGASENANRLRRHSAGARKSIFKNHQQRNGYFNAYYNQ